MLKFAVKRILFMIPSIIIITLVTFVIMSFSAGSPGSVALGITASPEDIAAYNHEVGYDRPVLVRYGEYMFNILHGDFGERYSDGVSVTQVLMPKFPTTLKLALLAVFFAALIGIPLGVLAAVKKGTIADTGTTVISLVLASIPGFWLGLLLMLLFSYQLGWLPTFGLGSWKNYVMPVATLAIPSSAYVARMVRMTMLEALSSDYVRTARAKGAGPARIVFIHVLRNAMLPVITQLGMSFAGLLGGAVIAEQIFGLPGFGSAILEAINKKETMVVLGATVFLSLLYMLIMLAMDLINALLNPKIRDNMG
ncbi:ABC transporter permease [uncultured Pseudoflavonifractor sp.]|uniref:ABC transporter permease n=1 Tax=uncultured Pseudoflavonifractor sp. TaxID=1221379 RepID=UPI0025E622DC|nr:ABC transporter permease [uncultured Pseudoflavonifractor sp.]